MGNFLFSHPIALVALVLGYVLLVVEFCIPGFGVPGVLGIVLAKAIHLDPALMASPIITTMVDAASLTVLFTIATKVMHVG